MGVANTKTAAKNSAAKPRSSDFVHLHTHSHYSLLDGLQKIPEMLDRVKTLGMDAVALTDHGTLSGVIEFYKEAKNRDLKPIIGLETYMSPRSHLDKAGKEDANPAHLILLAMNQAGYQNLLKLASIAHLEGFYYRPRIDRELLEKHNAGLIVLSGCASSEVGMALRQHQTALAEQIALWYRKVFGDRYYLELQDHEHEWPEQKLINDQSLTIGDKLDIPLVVTSDAHYCSVEDQEAHEVLLCVQTGSQLSDEKRMSLKNMNLFVSDPSDIARRWSKRPEVMQNTVKLAERCSVDIEFGRILIPTFPTPKEEPEQSYLERLAYQGLAWRYGNISKLSAGNLNLKQIKKSIDKKITNRLDYELSVIAKMGFAGYFLIVADFINWAKEQGIIIGPGRGSVAGSITAYSLNVTQLDPLEYNLIFERFLNPDRISMPDFDIDFQDDRRDEVIQYVVNKYGEDRVAQIVTFGKMAARNAIRDTARVLGVSYSDADRLSKMVPPPVQGRQIPLRTALQSSQELKSEYAKNPASKRVFDLAMRLEGTIRSHGVHAAGVVITPEAITKFTPLEMAQKGVVATQYSMTPIEELGLLKMDFLGLSNLTVIKNSLRIIQKVYNEAIDITHVPLDDQKTFALLSHGETTGVFQLESAGMKRYLKELKPNKFDDIIAMVSLYRPGPMAELPNYIDGKHHPEKVTYPHPTLEPILKDTYGVMVYQEQIIAMLQLIAGYSPGQADLVRKAIGKKKRDIMAAEKPKFIEGCLHQGLDKKGAEKLWKLLQPFADYSFNKSHAACYAMIAYQTAYLKAHYPSVYMAALLTSDYGNTDRITIELDECRRLGIEVLPPDVNESFVEFAVRPEDEAIRFGLAAIKNVGIGTVEKILEAREAGAFESIEGFANRVSVGALNRKTWESLIKAGAFNSLADQSQLLYNLDNILAYGAKMQKQVADGQVDLFAASGGGGIVASTLKLAPAPDELADSERLAWERALLGIYLSRHPLDAYKSYLAKTVLALNNISTSHHQQSVSVGGLITAVRKISTRNGAIMAFVTLEDLTGKIELIVFPRVYELLSEIWHTDRIIKVSGKVTTKEKDGTTAAELKLLVDTAEPIHPSTALPRQVDLKPDDPSADNVPGTIVVQLEDANNAEKIGALKELLDQYPGDSEVVLIMGGEASTRIKLPFTVAANARLQKQLEELFSKDAIAIKK